MSIGECMIGKVIKKHGGFYSVDTETAFFDCKLSGKQKHRQRDHIVAGDFVEFEPEANSDVPRGYITAIRERKNFIPRPGIANVDQILIVAAIREPSYDFLLLDKLAALSRYYGIPPTLCFSKMDLATAGAEQEVREYYRSVDIGLLFISQNDSQDVVRDFCRGKTTVLTGNSGVGKSSMINRLLGREVQVVQDISMKLNRGKNTTRTAEFFPFENGFIVDTPGFSALDLPPEILKTDLKELYPDYQRAAADCRFNNCIHINEPDCEVKALVEEGVLAEARYQNYKKMVLELEERERMRR